jgi:hypothetical protein
MYVQRSIPPVAEKRMHRAVLRVKIEDRQEINKIMVDLDMLDLSDHPHSG